MVYGLVLLLIALLNLFLGLFVLSRGSDKEVNRTFCYWTISCSLWNFMDFGLYFAKDPHFALVWAKILVIGVIFLPSTFFHFVVSFLREPGNKRRKILSAGYITSAIFSILSLSGFFVASVTPLKKGYFPIFTKTLLPPLFLIFFYGLTLAGVFLLIRRFIKAASPMEKNQLKYLLAGLLIAIVGGLSNFLLALGKERIFPIGNVAEIAFVAATTYTIIRYHLMDINLILRPGIAYTMLTASVTAIWLACIFLFENVFHFQTTLSRIMTITIFIFIFNILRERIQLIVDRLFYRQSQQLFSLSKKMTEEIATNYDPDLLIPYLLHQIEDSLRPEFISCMLLEKDTYFLKYLLGNGEEKVFIQADAPLIQWLSNVRRSIFYEELDEDPNFYGPKQEIKSDLNKIKARLIVPLIHRDELMGILSLGDKKGDGSYTYDEVSFLDTIAKELALSLENSRLHTYLKTRAKELEKANAAKSEFLNIVSHELKTPLTFIIAQLGILKKETLGRLTKSQKEGIKKIEEKGFKLSSIITDILNLSAIENKKFYELKVEKIYLKRLIDEVTRAFGLLIYHKGLSIELDLPDRLSSVSSDYEKISDIFYRLLDNAVKFTPSGGEITIEARETKVEIELSVSDTGIGIAKAEQEKIFERFYQADGSITRKYSGMGLGLAITSELVKALGGRIWVSSIPGKGSKFTFTIPKN
ncbi:MAG: ATP-binding protein [bacterium]|nr:ATP-binding protein [bacterium]